MADKYAYEERFRVQLAEWQAEIEKLQARAEKAKTDARIGYLEEVEKLRKQQQEAERRFSALQQSGSGAWEDMKAGADQAWNNLETAMKKAAARF